MSCVDEDTVLDFLRGDLADPEASRVEEHLDTCADCRELLSALARAGDASMLSPGPLESDASTVLALERTEASVGSVLHPPALFERGDSIGRYVVLEPLGSGGMGVVYAAYDPELDRKVALKLLRTDLDLPGGQGTSWLLREAQAMARLQHPNVITVHDVGELGGQVFVAMEHLEGVTLGEWLQGQGRTWREILAAFLQAGAGLAAAHEAGLVHRDFKPGNVMVTGGGQVKVLDFGLARPVTGGTPAADPDLPARPAVSTRLSRSGAVVGTPLYMAPEQHRGAPADARTDQFSYCLALYEALYGERPFRGESEVDLLDAKEEGHISDAPRGTKVPGSVRRALLKGLAPHREERYPDMDALLRALSRDRAGWRRVGIALAAGIALGLGTWALAAAMRAPPPHLVCKGAERKLEGVWDGQRQADVERAFLATGKPYARVAWKQVRRVLDGYTGRWVRARTEACEATRVRGEQSEQLLDLRMQCYARLLADAGALTRLFAHADAKVVERAVAAVHALDPLSRCADGRRLRSRKRPAAAVRARSQGLLGRMARARALERSGKYREGLAVARAVARVAAELGHRPLQAEAHWLLGSLEELAGDPKRALRDLQQALWAAQASGRDRLVALAASGLVQVYGYRLGKFEQARSWARFASAAVERLGGDPAVEAELACRQGATEYTANRYRASLGHLRRCLEGRRRALGDSHPDTAAAANDVGLVLWNLGRYAESLEQHRKALRLRRQLLGERHPEVSVSLNNLGLLYWTRGKFARAEDHFRRAIAIREAALGPKHADVATALGNLGLVLRAQGRYAEALRVQRRALAIREERLGPQHDDVATSANNVAVILGSMGRYAEALKMARQAYAIRVRALGKRSVHAARTLTNIGKMLHGLGRYREALAKHQEAVRITQELLGRNHPGLVKPLISVASTLTALGRSEEALPVYRRARRIAEQRRGKKHPLVALALARMGEVHLGRREWEAATRMLTQALRIFGDRPGPPLRLARVRFSLARALRGAGREPQRARALAQEALVAYRRAGGAVVKSRIGVIERWLGRAREGPARSHH